MPRQRLAGQIDNVSQFCREQQISRQTFYKWRRRFGRGRSGRAPRTVTAANSHRVRPRPRSKKLCCVSANSSLSRALTMGRSRSCGRCSARRCAVPSRSTVWRILTRHGLIVAAAPEAAQIGDKRFCFSRPNECWQSDWTGWSAGRWHRRWPSPARLDDHSRYRARTAGRIGQRHRRVGVVDDAGRHRRMRDPGNVVGRQRNGLHRSTARHSRQRSRPTCAPWAHTPSTPPRRTRRPAARSNGSGRP